MQYQAQIWRELHFLSIINYSHLTYYGLNSSGLGTYSALILGYISMSLNSGSMESPLGRCPIQEVLEGNPESHPGDVFGQWIND